jgi:hypothetical protein
MKRATAIIVLACMIVIVIGVYLGGVGGYRDSELALAFGCGRFYAGHFDPADDPRDERSKCYPYYKAWEKTERWPAR